jgi:hypothetical protein
MLVSVHSQTQHTSIYNQLVVSKCHESINATLRAVLQPFRHNKFDLLELSPATEEECRVQSRVMLHNSLDIGDNYSDHKHVSVHFLKFCFGTVVERNVTDNYSYFL